MLNDVAEHLKSTQKLLSTEILVVNDCSDDDTTQIALEHGKKLNLNLRVCELEWRSGKGRAVRHGMLHASGEQILFVDADGATKFGEVQKLQDAIDAKLGVAIGSRAHLVSSEAVVKRTFIRNMLMHAFHFVLSVLVKTSVQDTQCGFKLFTREAVRRIFPHQHVRGFIFDVEVLMIAEGLRIPVKEIPVQWEEVEGSKLNIGLDSIRMALDLLIIRLNYATWRWRLVQ